MPRAHEDPNVTGLAGSQTQAKHLGFVFIQHLYVIGDPKAASEWEGNRQGSCVIGQHLEKPPSKTTVDFVAHVGW